MRENADQNNSEYRHFSRRRLKDCSIRGVSYQFILAIWCQFILVICVMKVYQKLVIEGLVREGLSQLPVRSGSGQL